MSIIFNGNDNTNGNKLNNEGVKLLHLDQYEEAKEYFDQAILIDNSNPYYFYNRGVVFSNLKRYESAINDFESAIKINDSEPSFFYENYLAKINSSRIYRNKEVLKLLDKAIELEKYNCPEKVDYLEARSILARSMAKSLQADNDLLESKRIRYLLKPAEKYPGTSKRFKEMMEAFGEKHIIEHLKLKD